MASIPTPALPFLVLPAVIAAAFYLPSLANPLVWDDALHVPMAARIGVGEAFGNPAGEYRRPLVLLSYMAQAGSGPGGLHGANALLHGANTLLLALLLLELGLAPAVAGAAALVFASHPVQSGSVAYISGRSDLLAAFFTLAALLLAAREGHRNQAALQRGSTRAAVVAACSLCVCLAALSKEVGVAAGPLVALVVWLRRPSGRGPWLVLPIAALATSAACLPAVLPPAALTGDVSLWLRLRCVGTAALTYARLLLWPSGLHLDRLSATRGAEGVIVALAFGAGALAASIRFATAPTLLGLGVVSALALVLPGSGWIPVSQAIADHLVFTPEQYLYLPLAPLSALAAAAIYKYGGNRGVAVAAVLFAVLGAPSVLARQREFASAELVYRNTLAHSPSPRACFNLGNLELDARRYDDAALTYRRCTEMSPHDAGAYGQLAIAYQKLGRGGEARRSYQRAVDLDDRSPLLWSNFASLDASEGRLHEARNKWRRALSLDPAFEPAKAALAKLAEAGN